MATPQNINGVTYNSAGGYYSIDNGCNSLSSLPDIGFQIDGKVYSLPPVQWTQAVRGSLLCPLHPICMAHPRGACLNNRTRPMVAIISGCPLQIQQGPCDASV